MAIDAGSAETSLPWLGSMSRDHACWQQLSWLSAPDDLGVTEDGDSDPADALDWTLPEQVSHQEIVAVDMALFSLSEIITKSPVVLQPTNTKSGRRVVAPQQRAQRPAEPVQPEILKIEAAGRGIKRDPDSRSPRQGRRASRMWICAEPDCIYVSDRKSETVAFRSSACLALAVAMRPRRVRQVPGGARR